MLKNQTPPESLQDAFSRVWTHFITEGNPRSVDLKGRTCLYRTPDGNGCAVGILLPDEMAHKADACLNEKFGGAIDSILSNRAVPGLGKWLGKIDIYALRQLQRCHDDVTEDVTIRGQLIEFARENNLIVP